MSVSVTLYNFSKLENSTAQPSLGGTAYNCNIKSQSSIINPTLEFAFSMGTNVRPYNYCYIPMWGRYYWINDWVWTEGLWTAICHVDVLASFKDDITSAQLYVLRSTSNYDTAVIDTLYPAKTTISYAETSAAISGWAATQTLIAGWFVLGLINGDNSSNSYGSVSYYALNYNQMRNLLSYMFSDVQSWDSISDLSGDIAKPFLDPMQYITTCMFFPVQFTTAGIAAVPLKFGFWEVGSDVTGYPLGSAANTLAWTPAAISLSRPVRTDGARGEWTYKEPFATYKLVCYPWGVIDLPAAAITANGITVRIYVDYISGIGTLNVYNAISGVSGGEYSQLICSNQCQFGTPMSMSQVVTQYIPSSVGSLAGGIATDIFNHVILGQGSNVGSATLMGQTTASSSGNNGGVCQSLIMGGNVYFQMQYFTPANEDIAHYGRPLMQLATLGNLSGYCVVADGDVGGDATGTEKASIRAYLEGGFYIE